MKLFVLVALGLLAFSAPAAARGARSHSSARASGTGSSTAGPVHVHGYTKKNGKYVAPHIRSRPNKTKADNYSTKGNVNPETGKVGTKAATP